VRSRSLEAETEICIRVAEEAQPGRRGGGVISETVYIFTLKERRRAKMGEESRTAHFRGTDPINTHPIRTAEDIGKTNVM